MGLEFSKYQGSGNDFLIVYEQQVTPDIARRACDRHFGVGADGVIVVSRSEATGFSFLLLNADGGAAEVSGNGLRCVGKFLHDRRLTRETSIRVEAAGEVKVLDLILGDGVVEGVRVDMGVPTDEGEIILHGRTWRKINTGNPHAVTFVDDVEAAPVTTLGPLVERDPAFPNRTNVHFIKVDGEVIHARFWERGVGVTLACGTGSCAALVAAGLRRATVRGPGGDVQVERDEGGRVYLTGPAVHVFDGRLP